MHNYNNIPLAKTILKNHGSEYAGITNQYNGEVVSFGDNMKKEWGVVVNNECEYYYPNYLRNELSRILAIDGGYCIYEYILTKVLKRPKSLSIHIIGEDMRVSVSIVDIIKSFQREINLLHTVQTKGYELVMLLSIPGAENSIMSELLEESNENEGNSEIVEEDDRWEESRLAVVAYDLSDKTHKCLGEYVIYNGETTFDHKIKENDGNWEIEFKVANRQYEYFPYFSRNWQRRILKCVNGELIECGNCEKITYEELHRYFSAYLNEEHTPSGYFKQGWFTLSNRITGEILVETKLIPGQFACIMYSNIPRIMIVNIFNNKKKSNIAYVIRIDNELPVIDKVLELDYYAYIKFDEENEAVIIENGNETIVIANYEIKQEV